MKQFAAYSFVISLLWLGFVLSISFMEAPIKFTANGVSMVSALSIGRVVFQTLNKIELFFALILCLPIFMSKPVKVQILVFGVLLMVLLLQTVWLLPLLDERAMRVLAGETLAPSSLHWYYTFLEILKVSLLVCLSVLQIKGFATRGSVPSVN